MRALLVIADIGGYTQFMQLHRMSIAHAQENTDRLLAAAVDAAPRLKLVGLEGDAAFFWVPEPQDEEVASTVTGLTAAMHRSFHQRQQQMETVSLCRCDACHQIGQLRVKFVAHIGEVVRQSVRRSTTLAGVDVILVHRMLKNAVPAAEYLLMTEPVLERSDEAVRRQAHAIEQDLEGLGSHRLHYVDLAAIADELPPPPRPKLGARLRYSTVMTLRTLPGILRARR
jgi:uncharacterized protein DUF2652